MTSADSDSEQGHSPNEFPDYRRKISFQSVKYGYTLLCNNIMTLVFVPVAVAVAINLGEALRSGALHELYKDASQRELKLRLVTIVSSACVLCLIAYLFLSNRSVYLVNFSCYKPPAASKMTNELHHFLSKHSQCFNEEALDFQSRVLARSGLGEETYLPIGVRYRPPKPTMANARNEAEMVMFGAVGDALKKTGLKPSQIGVLVVNCSLFNPTPSLAAMIINKFKMRHDIMHFNLSGMGCSAGLIAIDLAVKMLHIHTNQYALVVSTENITQNWYFGNNRSMLLPNCLFRMGCSAVVLSNKWWDSWRAKYQLFCPVVRTMTGGGNDAAYNCIMQEEDEDGVMGVKLTRQLMGEAGRALKQNITTLGPLILPFSEQLIFGVNLVCRKFLQMKMKAYIPDFRTAFDHICIHTGGRAVIEEIEKQLKLTAKHVNPSKDTLFRYGNTSSSSIWYILSNIETKKGVRRGDRVWQIGFGSGFKCNSAVWRAMRNINEQHVAWVEGEEMETDPRWIDEYEAINASNARQNAQEKAMAAN